MIDDTDWSPGQQSQGMDHLSRSSGTPAFFYLFITKEARTYSKTCQSVQKTIETCQSVPKLA
jgi:hypothetical protein